jgi:superfamily I DNA/RNA helicase
MPHVTFTTAHKSKGREFSQVIVEGDFKSALNEDGEFVGLAEEEQNLLYVACTRAINVLEYNKTVRGVPA